LTSEPRTLKERFAMSSIKARTLPLLAALAALVSLVSLVGACGGAASEPASPEFDKPVPASEKRAELRLRVDLAPAQACEEAFDLALYKNRGIDLIEWDQNAGACAGRAIVVRYLPQRTSEAEILKSARGLAAKVERAAAK
jgi:hypothetical protein